MTAPFAIVLHTHGGVEAGQIAVMLTPDGNAFTATEWHRQVPETSWFCTTPDRLTGRAGGEWFFRHKPIRDLLATARACP